MKTTKGVPITGNGKLYKKQTPVLTNQAATSANAQRAVRQGAAKFANRFNETNVPASTQSYNRVNPNFAQDGLRFGGVPKAVSVKNKPTIDLSAVGEPRYPLGYNPVNSGFPLGGSRTAGQISTNRGPQANAKEMKRLRSTYPGIFGRGR